MHENKALKSIHITNYYHKNSGGISYAYDKLLEAANRHQRFVRLIVPGERDEQEEVGEFGRIYYVATKTFPLFDQRYRVMQAWNSYIFDKTRIRQILRAEQADIIEIAEKYSLSLLAGLIRKGYFKSLNRPLLVHLSCERMDDNLRSFVSPSPLVKWFARRVMGNYNFPMFDFHLANSDYTAQELFDSVLPDQNPRRSKMFFNFCWQYFHAARTPLENRIFVNQCGVDSKHFNAARSSADRRRALFAEVGFPENALVLLYAGRLSPEKNVKLLPALMKRLLSSSDARRRDYRLLIAGDGPQSEWLKNELERVAAGKFALLGHVTDKERLANFYANSDIFVHPNQHEPFGIAPLEAMASGVPLLAPNAGGVLSYADDENSWLAPATVEDYAAAVEDILSDAERRRMKIAKALETAQKYTWEASTDRIFSLYDAMHGNFRQNKELFDYTIKPSEINFADELHCNHLDSKLAG